MELITSSHGFCPHAMDEGGEKFYLYLNLH